MKGINELYIKEKDKILEFSINLSFLVKLKDLKLITENEYKIIKEKLIDMAD